MERCSSACAMRWRRARRWRRSSTA